MKAAEIIAELKPLGKESYKKVIQKHGVGEACFGVSVADLKKIQKRVKQDHALALELFDTGIYDAMYLAGLICDDQQLSPKDLNKWLKNSKHEPIRSSIVPWVAAESNHGWEVALEWIEANDEATSSAGWATLSSLVAIKADEELDLVQLKKLVERIGKTIKKLPGDTQYKMNSFLIAAGSYVAPLSELAITVANQIGTIEVDMGDTECKIPNAAEYIEKVRKRGSIGKKRATAKC